MQLPRSHEPVPPEVNEITHQVIGAAIEVHRVLGAGVLESTYQTCLFIELQLRGLHVDAHVKLPIVYAGVRIDGAYRLDLLVERQVVVELKAVAKILPIHHAQLLSYLRLGGFRVGLLMNFHVELMKDGIVRFAN